MNAFPCINKFITCVFYSFVFYKKSYCWTYGLYIFKIKNLLQSLFVNKKHLLFSCTIFYCTLKSHVLLTWFPGPSTVVNTEHEILFLCQTQLKCLLAKESDHRTCFDLISQQCPLHLWLDDRKDFILANLPNNLFALMKFQRLSKTKLNSRWCIFFLGFSNSYFF